MSDTNIWRKALCYGYIAALFFGLIYLSAFWGFPEICVDADTESHQYRATANRDLMICFYVQIGVLLLFGSSHLATYYRRRKNWDDDSFDLLDNISGLFGLGVWIGPGISIFVSLLAMLLYCNEFNSWLVVFAISDFLLLTCMGTIVSAVAIGGMTLLLIPIYFIFKEIRFYFISEKSYSVMVQDKEDKV
jgi:hypothetical protein